MSYRIKEGDTIKIFFSTHPAIVGVVKYTPCATGDAWHIENLEDGGIVYIQQYDCMVRQHKA